MSYRKVLAHLTTAMLLGTAGAAQAAILHDQNVVAIFGSGNADTNWTTDTANGLVLGLRAKVRFDATNNPANVFHSDGAGTFRHEAGMPTPGFGFQPNSPSSAKWNFEWSINSGAANLDAYDYQISLDFDPGLGTNFLTFDPINIPMGALPQDWADHAIGTAGTANGAGVSAGDRPTYLGLIGANPIAQNSWNMEFFDSVAFPFSGAAKGVYTFQLAAFEKGTTNLLSSTSINVNVPLPATVLLFVTGLAGLGYSRRRRSNVNAPA